LPQGDWPPAGFTLRDIGGGRSRAGWNPRRTRRSPEESVALLSDRDAKDVRAQLASLSGSVTLVNFTQVFSTPT